jgi:hypothetical protein
VRGCASTMHGAANALGFDREAAARVSRGGVYDVS